MVIYVFNRPIPRTWVAFPLPVVVYLWGERSSPRKHRVLFLTKAKAIARKATVFEERIFMCGDWPPKQKIRSADADSAFMSHKYLASALGRKVSS
jgi:hypothetical protein